jgi:hypothetical protein
VTLSVKPHSPPICLLNSKQYAAATSTDTKHCGLVQRSLVMSCRSDVEFATADWIAVLGIAWRGKVMLDNSRVIEFSSSNRNKGSFAGQPLHCTLHSKKHLTVLLLTLTTSQHPSSSHGMTQFSTCRELYFSSHPNSLLYSVSNTFSSAYASFCVSVRGSPPKKVILMVPCR